MSRSAEDSETQKIDRSYIYVVLLQMYSPWFGTCWRDRTTEKREWTTTAVNLVLKSKESPVSCMKIEKTPNISTCGRQDNIKY